MEAFEVVHVQRVKLLGSRFPRGHKMQEVIDSAATHSATLGFIKGVQEVRIRKLGKLEFWSNLLAKDVRRILG